MTDDKLQEILQSDKSLSLNEAKQIIYELKNDCVQYNDDQYKAGFYNGELNAFYICLDLLEKVDSSSIGIEKRLLILENDKRVRDIRDRVMSLFSNMQYGKLCSDPERTVYCKLKLADGKTKFVKCIDCKHKMFSDFYLECGIGRKGIVNRNDGCDEGERE